MGFKGFQDEFSEEGVFLSHIAKKNTLREAGYHKP